MRIELSRGKAPVLPLGVLVADTEGGMGYMIEQSLQNRLKEEKIEKDVVTLITQIVVDRKDPSINNPDKFIGQFYTEEEAKVYQETRNWDMKQDSGRGWRRVVPSPMPLQIVNGATIKEMVSSGKIVIAGGGGGIPVYLDSQGRYQGVDAVIDKDLASAVIGREIGASVLAILTSVDKVSINFDKPNQKELDQVTLSEIKDLYNKGHFPAGSMGPKILAAIKFIEDGGQMVTITSFEKASDAIDGNAGTRIIPD